MNKKPKINATGQREKFQGENLELVEAYDVQPGTIAPQDGVYLTEGERVLVRAGKPIPTPEAPTPTFAPEAEQDPVQDQ